MPKIHKELSVVAQKRGVKLVGGKVLYVILGIIFPIMPVNVVALALMQKNINKLYGADELSAEETITEEVMA